MRVLRGLVMLGVMTGMTLGGCNCNRPDTTEDAGTSGNMGSGGASNGGVSSSGASNGGLSSSGASNGGMSSSGASNGGLSSSGASNGGLSSSGASNGGLSSSGASNGGLSSSGASNGGASSGTAVMLTITRMIPTAGYRGEDTVVQLLGTGFVDGATVTFTHRDDAAQPGGTFNLTGVMTGAGTTLNVLLATDMARPLGLYIVTVTQGADMATAPELFRVTLAPPPTVTDVTPAFAFAGNPVDGVLSDRVLTLTGGGFRTGAVVEFQAADSAFAVIFEATDVAVENLTTISATIPSESQSMPLGRYFVTVTNPDGQAGTWLVTTAMGLRRGTVEVRDVPPPRITAIEPSRPTSGTVNPLTVSGENFQAGATVSLIASDGTECPASMTTVPTGMEGMTLVATLNVGAAGICSIDQGDYFLVRVTNPDGQFADFSSLHIYSNTTGKLSDFTTATANPLSTGRARHDSTVFFDDVCGASLVLAGGEGAHGGPVAPLTDVERATITPFGDLGAFTQLYTANDAGARVLNTLQMPRLGAQVANLGNWVFVLGGMDAAGTATSTAERATILTRATAVGAGFAEPAGSGSLPQGRFHYRVSAVLPDGERFSGEGLASRSINTVGQPDGSIAVVFESYPAAVAYRVYRSVAPGAGPGLVTLIASGNVGTPVSGMAGLLRFVDTGEDAMGASPGNVAAAAGTVGGSLPSGFYGYRVSAVRTVNGTPQEAPAGPAVVAQTANSMQQVSLSWDPVPGATAYRIYRTPSTGLTGTPADGARAVSRLAEVTTTTHTDDGSVALTSETPVAPEGPLPRGSLGRFTMDPASNLNVARQGHEVARVPLGRTWPEVRLYAVGGRDGRTGTTLGSAEHGQLTAQGHITWTAMTFNNASVDLAVPRANFVLGSNAGSRESLGCASNPAPPDPCENPDRDGDGYRSVACGGTDCDDTRPDVNLNHPEICTDGVDNDCDTLVDGADPECAVPDAGMPPQDAGNPPGDSGVPMDDGGMVMMDAGNPPPDSGQPVDSGMGVDAGGGVMDAGGGTPDAASDPCRFLSFADADGDGFRKTQCGGTDCDDTNPNVNPGVFESPLVGDGLCQNGVDEDCNGTDAFCVGGAFPAGPWAVTGPEEIYLLAAAGSSAINGTAETDIPLRNNGTPYAEVAFVRADGSIEEWLPALAPNGFGANGVGGEGLFYFNYLYVFGGSNQGGGQHIDRTTTCLPTSDDLPNYAPDCGVVPNAPQWSSLDDLLSNQDSTAQGMSTNRVFFSSERAFSKVFVLGGYNAVGGTLLQSVESASE